MSMHTRTRRAAAVAGLLLVLAACGGDGADSGTTTDTPVEEPSMDPSMPGMDMGS